VTWRASSSVGLEDNMKVLALGEFPSREDHHFACTRSSGQCVSSDNR
jgi:hypothetical protein